MYRPTKRIAIRSSTMKTMRLFVISRSRTLKYPSCYAPAPHQAFGAEPGAPSALQARRKALGDHDPRPSNTVINESVEYLMEEIIKGMACQM